MQVVESAEYQEALKIGEKYATFRQILMVNKNAVAIS
jgi:hypothetical protein